MKGRGNTRHLHFTPEFTIFEKQTNNLAYEFTRSALSAYYNKEISNISL